jgi:hypothetical protein
LEEVPQAVWVGYLTTVVGGNEAIKCGLYEKPAMREIIFRMNAVFHTSASTAHQTRN